MDPNEIRASLLLTFFPALTPGTHHKLLTAYTTAVQCVLSGPRDWLAKGFIPEEGLETILGQWPEAERFAQGEWEEMSSHGIGVCLYQDQDYPRMLREVAVPPPIIYVWGKGLSEEALPLALVGSRRPTYYGEKMARVLAGELAECGVTTVSGLARGVDSCVHDETLKRDGATWAVLGSGLLNLYPKENKRLAERILENGTLISEFPLHAPPFQGHFPRRNRIIAGLSHATIVVEGDEKSGSLITARLAAEEGRDVFAVPGPVFSRLSRGPHRLIQNGAALVTGVDDIIQELPDHIKIRLKSTRLGSMEASSPEAGKYKNLLLELESTALSRDVLGERLRIAPPTLAALLLELELKGLVRSIPGGFIEKT